MRHIVKILILLCTCLTAVPLHAQENSDLKGTSCVPVRTVSEEELAFQSGETMSFVLHYKWGSINADVGNATVRLDSVTFNGQKAFCCSAFGKTTKVFDLFFKVREDFKSWFTRDGLRPLKFTRDTYGTTNSCRIYETYCQDIDSPVYMSDGSSVTCTGEF